jgi:hypothetical protein
MIYRSIISYLYPCVFQTSDVKRPARETHANR